MSKERPNNISQSRTKIMSVTVLNTRKEELYKAQEAILNSAMENKRSLTAVETENLDKFTNEIKDLEKQVKALDAITMGRAGLAKPTSEIVLPTSSQKKSGTLSNGY